MKDATVDEAMTRKTTRLIHGMTGSTASTVQADSTPPKDVLELGRAIVRQLELDRRGELPSRWMAHHLAELITAAQTASGEPKQQAEDRAAELILKLWVNRRALPTPADPLHGHLAAIKTLGAMLPDADPWHRFQRSSNDDALLRDMFVALVNLVLGGLLLTRGGEMRRIEDAEWDALSEEEQFLVETLDRWQDFVVTPAPDKISLEIFFSRFSERDGEANVEVEASDAEPAEKHDPDPDPEREQRAAILAHVEIFQARLADLIEGWRSAGGLNGPAEVSVDDE